MPEGDTIAWFAGRLAPVLEGRAVDEVFSPRNPRWSERLEGRKITAVNTYGKHLFVHFDRGLVLHSHLGMTGSWRVARERRRWPRAWLLIRAGDRWAAQLGGSTLELMTAGRARFDQRLAGLGPDVLAARFDTARFLRRLREDDQTRPIGDALLDQRNLAGVGNIWKSEGCWEAQVDPWRPVSEVGGERALAIVEQVRPRMMRSAADGPRAIAPRVYRRSGMPCPRCGAPVRARGQGEQNRITYWCPGCQS